VVQIGSTGAASLVPIRAEEAGAEDETAHIGIGSTNATPLPLPLALALQFPSIRSIQLD
jgi:hypothetical protein